MFSSSAKIDCTGFSNMYCQFVIIILQVTFPRYKGARGIYLREPYQLNRVTRFSLNIDATFHEDACEYYDH